MPLHHFCTLLRLRYTIFVHYYIIYAATQLLYIITFPRIIFVASESYCVLTHCIYITYN